MALKGARGTQAFAIGAIGLALLVVLFFGLAYFGRLGDNPVGSDLCTLEGGLYCIDQGVRRDSISLLVQNGADDSLTVKDVRVKEKSETPKHICESVGGSIFLSRGEQKVLILDVCEVMDVDQGKKYAYTIDYVYQVGNSDVGIMGHGEMEGTVQ